MWEASGMVNLSLCISKTVTDIYLKQVTHERNILFEDKKAYKAQHIRTSN